MGWDLMMTMGERRDLEQEKVLTCSCNKDNADIEGNKRCHTTDNIAASTKCEIVGTFCEDDSQERYRI